MMKCKKYNCVFCVIFLWLTACSVKGGYELRRFGNLSSSYDIGRTKKQGFYRVGPSYTLAGKTYHPKEDKNYKEIGIASWYGVPFHGKKTSNGEIYDMYSFSAAHKTLPLPCIVRVTNLKNGKHTKVRVNDRGPFVGDRIIDVSYAVARKLDFHKDGTAKVKVEYLKKDSEKLLATYKR